VCVPERFDAAEGRGRRPARQLQARRLDVPGLPDPQLCGQGGLLPLRSSQIDHLGSSGAWRDRLPADIGPDWVIGHDLAGL